MKFHHHHILYFDLTLLIVFLLFKYLKTINLFMDLHQYNQMYQLF